MEQRVGTLASTFVTYGGGGLAIGLLMLVFGGERFGELKELPWWVFTAGLMGLVIVSALGITVDNLGLGAGLTLFTAATLIIGAGLEHVGWFAEARPIDLVRALGIGLVILGTWLVLKG
jgi:transporter family-2 protein